MTNRWRLGDHIMLREIYREWVWSAKPVIVIRDAPELVAVAILPGICWKQPRSLDGGRVGVADVLSDRWALTDQVGRAAVRCSCTFPARGMPSWPFTKRTSPS